MSTGPRPHSVPRTTAQQELTAALRAQIDQLSAFQTRLMLLLQQVTAYVDTKDRDAAGGALVLNAALSGLAEVQAKYKESMAAREHRYEARTAALTVAHEELRGMLGVAQQAIVALKREFGRGAPEHAGTQASEPVSTPASEHPGTRAPRHLAPSHPGT